MGKEKYEKIPIIEREWIELNLIPMNAYDLATLFNFVIDSELVLFKDFPNNIIIQAPKPDYQYKDITDPESQCMWDASIEKAVSDRGLRVSGYRAPSGQGGIVEKTISLDDPDMPMNAITMQVGTTRAQEFLKEIHVLEEFVSKRQKETEIDIPETTMNFSILFKKSDDNFIIDIESPVTKNKFRLVCKKIGISGGFDVTVEKNKIIFNTDDLVAVEYNEKTKELSIY